MTKHKTLLERLKPYTKLYCLDLFFALMEAMATLFVPIVVHHVIRQSIDVNADKILPCLMLWGFVLFGLILIIYFSNFFIVRYGYLVGAFIEQDMRRDLFANYQKLSCDFFDNQEIGKLISRVTVDLFNFTDLFHRGSEELLITVME